MNMIHTGRRGFLAGSGAVGLAMMAGCTNQEEGGADTPAPQPYDGILGVQLYTVRDLFEKDAKATLGALAEIGFKDVETAGLFEHKATEVRAIMDDLGIVSQSAHVSINLMRDDAAFAKALEDAIILGQTHLYLPWISEEERTPDGYRSVADLLNARGEQVKAEGKMVGYHNHEFEFIEQDGTTGYDILLDRTDPDKVTMELDFFWVADAGKNPMDIFKSAPDRFSACHIKDRTATGDMVAVGDGEIDFKTLLPLAGEAGISRFYVEHDNPEEPLASVARSFAHLTG